MIGNNNENKKVLIFDLDDTIVECQYNYCKTIVKFLDKMTDIFGKCCPHPKLVALVQEQTDIELMRKHLFNRERFPNSMVLTYKHFHKEIFGNEYYNENYIKEIEDIGFSVYKIVPKPIENAIETLKNLKLQGYILYMYTLGDLKVQKYKIINNRLDKIFDWDHIFIRPKKTVDELAEIYDHIKSNHGNILKRDIYMVGDSLRSDIVPAINFGINAIQVLTNSWAYNNIDAKEKNYLEISKIDELTNLGLKQLLY